MTVVVTGAAGFIAGHLTARLLRDGHRVVGVDRRPLTPRPRFVRLRAELATRNDSVHRALKEAEAVFHLAGCPGVRSGGPGITRRRWQDNVLAGARVLETVPDRVPVVVTSSSSVYGGARLDGGQPRASREDDPLRPRGGYARSKVALERLCAERTDRGGAVAVVRPFTVAGEGQRPDMAVARWLAAARRGRPLVVLGDPGRLRDVTDVRHVVEGLVRLASRTTPGTLLTVNLGTGRPRSLADMVAVVARVTGVEVEVVVQPADPRDPPATRADVRRCAHLLGFVPRTDLSGLVARQAAAASRWSETTHRAVTAGSALPRSRPRPPPRRRPRAGDRDRAGQPPARPPGRRRYGA